MVMAGYIWKVLGLLMCSSEQIHASSRIWGTMSMDHSEDCDSGTRRPNIDISEGDVFLVESGSRMAANRQPAECTVGFNFGDRLLSVVVKEWSCDDRTFSEPFLAFYDDCVGQRKNKISWLNCSDESPTGRVLTSLSTCVSIYHYRGHRYEGYHFTLNIVAGYELLAFPAGGIAAIVISIVVAIMIVAKIVCCISGYERRLPNIDFDDNTTKQNMAAHRSSIAHSPDGATEPIIRVDPGDSQRQCRDSFVENRSFNNLSTYSVAASSTQERTRQHSIPTSQRLPDVSRPSFSGSYIGTSGGDVSLEYDYDFLDLPIDLLDDGPRLKRYPSARASSIWRHK